MAAGGVLHMVIVGAEDVPLFEADLTAKTTDAGGREVRCTACCGHAWSCARCRWSRRQAGDAAVEPFVDLCCRKEARHLAVPTPVHTQSACPRPHLPQERPQYLYHFVLHAALDAVEEQEWRTTAMHLGVVDRFNNLQVRWAGTLVVVGTHVLRQGGTPSTGVPSCCGPCACKLGGTCAVVALRSPGCCSPQPLRAAAQAQAHSPPARC